MAKKNLSALMSGLIGDEPEKIYDETEPTIENPDYKKEEQKDLSSSRQTERKKRGRPTTNTTEVSATFKIDSEVLRKMKYICFMDEVMQKDILDSALRHYISAWEKKNGAVPRPKN